MIIEVCNIKGLVKQFKLLHFFISRYFFAIAILRYWKNVGCFGYGLFSLEIGEFMESGRSGIRIRFLRWGWSWYRKEAIEW